MFVQIKKDRDLYFDFLRGVLVLLVLLGHAIQYGNGDTYFAQGGYWDNPLMKAIYSFHMPLFSGVSGYFCFRSAGKGRPLAVYFRRCKRLLLPALMWTFLASIFKAIAIGHLPSIASATYRCVCDYWFIWAILLSDGLIQVVVRLRKPMARFGLYAVLVLLALLTPDILWVNAAFKYVIPFYVLGYELAQKGWHPSTIKIRNSVVAMLLWILLLCLYRKESYIYTSLFSVTDAIAPGRQLLIDLFRWLIAGVGCYACCGLTQWVWSRLQSRAQILRNFVTVMGQHSLAIYILSTPLYLHVVPKITFGFEPSVLSTGVITISVAAICMVLTALLGKHKGLSKLLLGE